MISLVKDHPDGDKDKKREDSLNLSFEDEGPAKFEEEEDSVQKSLFKFNKKTNNNLKKNHVDES